jgi:uncharacterized protein (TIGR03382 family)
MAVLRVGGRIISLGQWATREEMEIARDRAVLHRNVPTPGAIALLGVAGLISRRRRR